MGRKAAESSLNVVVKADDQVSGAVKRAADSVGKSTQKMIEQNKKLVEAAQREAIARKGQLSASKQLQFAMRKEAAEGNKLEMQIVELEEKHARLTAKMRAMLSVGAKIPQQMIREANAAKQKAAELRNASGATSNLSNASVALSSALGVSLAGAFMSLTRAISSSVTETIALGDQLQKISQRTGVTVEAIQELRFAAESAGVESSRMDDAIKKLGKSVGEAAIGTATYRDAFDALGVEIRDQDGNLRDLDAILMDVADGLEEQTSQADRLALAQRILGRSGMDLVNVLQDGSAALALTREEARRLGVLSAKAAENSERLTQEMTNLTQRTLRLKTAIGEGLVPDITRAVAALGKLIDYVDENSERFTGLFRAALAVSTLGMSELLTKVNSLAFDALPDLEEQTDDTTDAFDELNEKLETSKKISLSFGNILIKEVETQKKATKAARERAKEEKELADLLDQAELSYNRALERREKAAEKAAKDREKAIEDAVKRAEEAAKKEAKQIAERQQDYANIANAIGNIFATTAAGAEDSKDKLEIFMRSTLSTVIGTARGYAVSAAIKAADSQAGIPVIGPVLAGAAAATIFALMQTYLAKFDKGGIVRGGVIGRDSVPVLAKDGEGFMTPQQVDLIQQFTRALERGQQPMQQGRPLQQTIVIRSDIPPRDIEMLRAARRLDKAQRNLRRRGMAV